MSFTESQEEVTEAEKKFAMDSDQTQVPDLEVDNTGKSDLPKDAGEQRSRSTSPSDPMAVDENSKVEDPIVDEKAPAAEDPSASETIAPRPEAWKFWAALSAMLCCAFLYGLDTTIAADVQASIYQSLGDIGKIAWVGIGFPLGSASTILPIGQAYAKFNQKILFCVGLVLFEGGSALCGGAPTMNGLICGRVIAGIGGCSIYLGGLNFITIYTTMRERSLFSALLGLIWAFGTILGPVIGGAFASSGATWRWAFYINLCIAVIVGPTVLLLMPSYQPMPNKSLKKKLAEMDWVGIVLIASSFTTFILAFSLGGNEWGWSDGRWIAMIVVFGVVFISFIIQQSFRLFTTKEMQLFPVEFVKRRTMVLLFITMSALNSAFFVGVYYIPLYFQFVHGDSAIQAAVRLLPFICVGVTVMMVQGALLPVLGYYFPWYIIAGIFTLIGGCVMHTIDPSTPISRVYGFSLFTAIGAGIAGQSGYALAAAKARNLHEVAHTIGFINTAQIGGVSIALCVSGQIFQSKAYSGLTHALAGSGFTPQEIRDTIAGTKSAVFESGTPAEQSAAIHAITDAIDSVYIQAIAIGALTLVCALLMRREKLNFNPTVSAG